MAVKDNIKEVDFDKKIEIHARQKVYATVGSLLAVILIVIVLAVQFNVHVYSDYDVVSSTEITQASDARNITTAKSVITYSKDGASCINSKGDSVWNMTFEIQDIVLAQSGSTVAIGDYNGRNIYVANEEKQICDITTTMPLRDLTVAKNGYTTAVLYEKETTHINTYNDKGEMIYSGETHMQNSGYPAALSLSPSGELLAVSFIYVDAGAVKSNVAFYNFGPVGDNQSDYIVSVYPYSDLVVPTIHFLDDETAFAVGDSRLMLYSGAQKPESKAEFIFDQEIKSVFYSNKYIGLVFYGEGDDSKYRMEVYSKEGQKVGEYKFDLDYTDIFFQDDLFVAYNESGCFIETLKGKVKYEGLFEKTVRLMTPLSKAYRYSIVTNDDIEVIQLK